MQGVIYLFFNNVMATHPGDYLLFPSSGVQFQNLGRRLTSVTPCFPLLPGCSSTTSNSSSPQRLLAFPSSGVPNQNLGQRLTSVTPCFSLFRGAVPRLAIATHPRAPLTFPLPGCQTQPLPSRLISPPQTPHTTGKPQKPPPTPRGPAFRLVPRNIS